MATATAETSLKAEVSRRQPLTTGVESTAAAWRKIFPTILLAAEGNTGLRPEFVKASNGDRLTLVIKGPEDVEFKGCVDEDQEVPISELEALALTPHEPSYDPAQYDEAAAELAGRYIDNDQLLISTANEVAKRLLELQAGVLSHQDLAHAA